MKRDDWVKLAPEVQDFIWDNINEFSDKIEKDFSLNEEQANFILDLSDDIISKKIPVLDLPKNLEKIPGQFEGDFRDLALQIAIEMLWPLQENLGGVDRLILRLGGKVPRPIFLKKKKTTNDSQTSGIFHGNIKNLLKKHEEFKDFRLTPNKIIDEKGRMTNPSVQNWIKDYVHFLGAGQHSSLQRAEYIAKSENALKLSDKYKDSLRFLLLSYDEGVDFYFDSSQSLLSIKEEVQKKSDDHHSDVSKIDFDKVLNDFKNRLDTFQKRLLPSDMIISEAGGDINKVRDILWQAIGIEDKDKAISCLNILLSKNSFNAMIKEDNRFRNILKRFIGIKYGQNMERSLDETIDPLIVKRIFLEMFLADKLRLLDKDLYTAAYYLTNNSSDSGQVVYLDKKDQQFKWLAVQVMANKFVWADKI